MALRSHAARLLLSGALLLSLLPIASAQAPSPATAVVGFAILCPNTFLEVDYLGVAEAYCSIYDYTRDAPGIPGTTPSVGALQHYTTLKMGAVTPPTAKGWQVTINAPPVITSYSGDIIPFSIRLQTTPLVNTQDYEFQILANFTANGVPMNQTIVFSGQVNAFDIAHPDTVKGQARAGQGHIVTYHYTITNDGVFPDVYTVQITGPDDFAVTQPGTIYVPPGETRNVTFSVLTPHDKIYELGRSVSFSVKFMSTRGTGVYPRSALLHVEGAYVPSYWIPMTLVGLAAGAVVVRRTRESMQVRALEKGRPRRVAVTPRQAVLLAELKRTDPAAFRERQKQLAAVYATRRERYREEHKAQLAKDREERRIAKREYAAAKKQKKLDRRAAAAQRAEEKKAAKRQRKLDKKAAKVEARQNKKKEKVLDKKRGQLEKAREKQAAIDAKQAAKDEKAAAKAQAAAAKEAKAAARAAKKAAKKGEQPPPGEQ